MMYERMYKSHNYLLYVRTMCESNVIVIYFQLLRFTQKYLILFYDLSNFIFFDLYFMICLCGLFVPIFV